MPTLQGIIPGENSKTVEPERKPFRFSSRIPVEMVDRVFVYRAPTTVVETEEITDWLSERLPLQITVRDRFLEWVRQAGSATTEDLTTAFASARIHAPTERETGNMMLGIQRYEERVLDQPERGGGVLYDGIKLQRKLNDFLPTDERSLENLHVALLDRTLGTWGHHDGRWHKRVNVLGQPSLVSVPGLYEAPAKPEAYYKEKQRHALLSGDTPPREVLENEIEDEFLLEDDPRTTDTLKGYVLQAIHLVETGEAFCETEGCRLSNPHRQPGVIEAQLRTPEFCDEHAKLYES